MNVGNCFPLPGKIETECLSVVLFQMSLAVVPKSKEEVMKNVDKLIEWIERAVTGYPGLDMIVTPEASLNGVGPHASLCCISLEGPELALLKETCKEYQIWLVVGACVDEEDGNFYKNCGITINDRGEIVDVYRKVTPWNPVEPTSPGDEINVFAGPKGARIATIICSDGDYQDNWREAATKGANVVLRLTTYMTPFENAYEITNRAGAYFNKVYVVAVNNSEMDDCYSLFGRSMVVNPEGDIITQAPVGLPYIFKADLYPGICDAIQKQAYMGDLIWLGNHRGAASPDMFGIGKDKQMYQYLRQEEN
ncbi:nitrilase-related carbon-nitrogen hydrolase [Enterococcus alishanensis]|uniref:CN hydrolase domain-containing protein n=1 Tax=Enterococcus alishanensis TaxID=1303817 RepID=A0ABS6T9J4_9ENTE|nr:nitrilase-related carbon-nitrogen hydrolase [Enterococcus alishanensis]MBV7389568.1 hypothetical protein [Enterococcus alishanensis]